MTGGDLVADVLVKQGVPYIFTLCGGHISPILVSAKQRGIRVIDVRDEVTAAFAADATSRLTGSVGVAAVTAGTRRDQHDHRRSRMPSWRNPRWCCSAAPPARFSRVAARFRISTRCHSSSLM